MANNETQIATVEYQVATYSGTVQVQCHIDDDNDVIEARAKAQLRRQAGSLPYGYESFRVVDREQV